jgi:hypothetical protein
MRSGVAFGSAPRAILPRYHPIPTMRTRNPWFGLSMQGARLAWDAQTVIALRLMRLGLGGTKARSEAQRMVTEKFAALAEAQARAAAAVMTGQSGQRAAKKVLSVYQKRVRRNRRRLVK